MVVESRSVIRNAKNAATAPFPKSCASYFRFARFNTFPLYYLRAWHRLQTADCIRQHDCELNETKNIDRNKGGVIINITLFRKVRPRSEVYIFHANYTDLIPKGAVGYSFRIELEQNNVYRCQKLAHESIATV